VVCHGAVLAGDPPGLDPTTCLRPADLPFIENAATVAGYCIVPTHNKCIFDMPMVAGKERSGQFEPLLPRWQHPAPRRITPVSLEQAQVILSMGEVLA